MHKRISSNHTKDMSSRSSLYQSDIRLLESSLTITLLPIGKWYWSFSPLQLEYISSLDLLRRSLTKVVVLLPIFLRCIAMRHQVSYLAFGRFSTRNLLPEILELPGNLQYSTLEFWTPNPDPPSL